MYPHTHHTEQSNSDYGKLKMEYKNFHKVGRMICLAILLMAIFPLVSAIYLPTGLQAYYNFEEQAGTIAYNYFNESIYNITVLGSWVSAGKINGSYQSLGTDNVQTRINPIGKSDYSFSFWLKRIGAEEDGGIITYDDCGADGEMGIYISTASKLNICINDGVGNTLDKFTPRFNTWEHLAVTTNTTGIYVYVNGALNQSLQLTTFVYNPSGGHPGFYMFEGGAGSGSTLENVILDEVAIFNRTLNQTDVQDLYNSGTGVPFSQCHYEYGNLSKMVYCYNPGTSPTINLYTPRTNINLGYYNKYEVLNYSVNGLNYAANIKLKEYSTRNLTLYGGTNSNYTVWNYSLYQNTLNYSASTYETSNENISLDVNYNAALYSDITGSLVYNGTAYTSTRSLLTNQAIFTTNKDIETVTSPTTKNVYWNISLTNSSGVFSFIFPFTQTINPIQFGICNSTLNVQYINFTFKDESNSNNINAAVDLSTWLYSLGTTQKSYTFTNTTSNSNYAFCLIPSSLPLSTTVTFKYSNTSYPQRTFYLSSTLSNSTTNRVLYLLSSSSGIYSSIQVLTTYGTAIQGATVLLEREISGSFVTIEQGTSDSSGLVTFWVNPNYDYRITTTKTGYSSSIVSIRPSQSTYTVMLGDSSANYTYNLEGIEFITTPSEYFFLKKNTDYDFQFNITAKKGNLVRYKIELRTQNGTILNFLEGTNPYGSNLSLTQNTLEYGIILGFYYVDLGDGYYLIDPNQWVITNEMDTSGSIYEGIRELLNYRSSDDMETKYGQLWFFFFFLYLIIAAISYYTGSEMSNTGAVLIIIWVIFGIFSYSGFFSIPFVSSNSYVNFCKFQSLCDITNNWGVFLMITWVFIGLFLRKMRESR